MIIKCDNCDKEFDKKQSQINRSKNHYCSVKCMSAKQSVYQPGDSVGSFILIERDYTDNKSGYWKVQCQCGKIQRKQISKTDMSSKCRTCSVRKYVGKLSSKFYKQIIWSAKRRKLEFDLSQEFLWDLFVIQKGKCYFSGATIDFADRSQDHIKGLTTASLDRLDSSKGYTKDNVVWVHKYVNSMKMDLTPDEFIGFCQKVASEHPNEIHSNKKYIPSKFLTPIKSKSPRDNTNKYKNCIFTHTKMNKSEVHDRFYSNSIDIDKILS